MKLKVKKFEELTAAEIYEILKARAQVFLLEQGIICQDMDDFDYKSHHFYFLEDNGVIAYLRAFKSDDKTVKIGRVLSIEHNKGLGTELMEKTIEYIKQNTSASKIALNSQKTAIDFYKRFGFSVVSPEFLEEGVLHVKMELYIK